MKTAEQHSREVAAKVYELLRAEYGTQVAARRLAGIKGPNYYAAAARTGAMSLRSFLAALAVLDIQPQAFFDAFFPKTLAEYAMGEEYEEPEPPD